MSMSLHTLFDAYEWTIKVEEDGKYRFVTESTVPPLSNYAGEEIKFDHRMKEQRPAPEFLRFHNLMYDSTAMARLAMSGGAGYGDLSRDSSSATLIEPSLIAELAKSANDSWDEEVERNVATQWTAT